MKRISMLVLVLCSAASTFAANASSKQVKLIGSSDGSCASSGLIYFNLDGENEGSGPRNFTFNANHVLAKVWLSKLESAMAAGLKVTVSYSTTPTGCIVYGFPIAEMQITP